MACDDDLGAAAVYRINLREAQMAFFHGENEDSPNF